MGIRVCRAQCKGLAGKGPLLHCPNGAGVVGADVIYRRATYYAVELAVRLTAQWAGNVGRFILGLKLVGEEFAVHDGANEALLSGAHTLHSRYRGIRIKSTKLEVLTRAAFSSGISDPSRIKLLPESFDGAVQPFDGEVGVRVDQDPRVLSKPPPEAFQGSRKAPNQSFNVEDLVGSLREGAGVLPKGPKANDHIFPLWVKPNVLGVEGKPGVGARPLFSECWWLVVGGWLLVVGGWWLVIGDWWLVIGGWWLVVGGW